MSSINSSIGNAASTKKKKSVSNGEEEVQTSIRISKLLTRAKHYAIDNGTSLASIFVKALEQYLDDH